MIRGRLAPSPTGRMHLGNAMSALFAALSVRSRGGTLVLRIEDIDPDRSKQCYADAIMDDFDFLGFGWDEGPYYQHDRSSMYLDALDSLKDHIYPCFCSRAELHAVSAPHASDGTYIYSGRCRSLSPADRSLLAATRKPAIRLRVPDETITFHDGCYGEISQNLALECGDFILRRSDGAWAYQLAVSVDDALMDINDVVRGNDLLSSAPRQIYLHRLLGHTAPHYTHTPLLLAPDGRRLSKREHDLDMEALRSRFTAKELLGRLAYLAGLLPEVMPVSFDELLPLYDPAAIPKHGIYVPDALFTK